MRRKGPLNLVSRSASSARRRLAFPTARLLLVLLFLFVSANTRHLFAAVYLFDNTKAETAGNADWVIDANSGTVPRIPTPPQSGITASTPESYWLGALSAWAVELVQRGNIVESLPTTGRITFGDATNVQDLSHYDVYVVCEPNILFTAAEKIALAQFVRNGGGLFMISDHDNSDRNNDGADSVAVWNDFLGNNGVADDEFGVVFNLTDISLTATTVATSATDPLIHGPEGPVASLKYSNGATMTINTTNNASVKGAVWSNSSRTASTVMTAYGSLGQGRFVAIGDSSPEDDGTGASSDTLYPGWTENGNNHPNLILNGCAWLQHSGVAPVNDNFAQAIDLGADGSGIATAVGTNVLATHEASEPIHAGNAGARSVWWQFTALADGTATATTAGSNFDTLLAVYTGSAVNALTPIVANDNDGALTTSRVSFAVTAGVTYRIAVDGKSGASGHIALALTLPRPPVPPNDNFSSATVLGAGSVTAVGDNLRATKQTGEPNHAGNAGGKSVWWRWTASVSRSVTISTAGSNFDTLLGVYTGTAVNALTTVTSNNNDGTNLTSKVTFNAVANTVYRIAVDGLDGDAGNIALAITVAPPANDNFASAITLTGTAPTTTGSNVSATKEAGEPNHAGNAGGSSVWWRWTAPASGYASISTAGSTFDSVLAVYTGTAVNSLTLVASNDQANGVDQSQVSFAVTANTIYRIAVDGANNAQGSVALAINGSLPPPQVSISTVDSGASERPLDSASFSLSLDPPQPQAVSVSVNLGGTATPAVDYSLDAPLNGNTATVTFAPLQTSRLVTLTPIPDNDPTEFDESILATLNAGAAYQIAVGTASAITLHDDTPYNSAWAQQFAPTFSGAAAAPLADFNGNGVSNLLEFAFNGDPLSGNLAGANGVPLLPVLGLGNFPDPNDGNVVKPYPTITFTRRTDAPGLVYAVQSSSTLVSNSWDSNGAVQISVTTAGMPAGTELVTYRSSQPAAGTGAITPQFLRVSVTAP